MARKKDPKLRFNCYLLREGIEDPEKALRVSYRPGGANEMLRLAASANAPAGIVGYFRARSEKVPTWAEVLTPIFPTLSEALNTSNRLVIVLPVSGRLFAICFGYGSSTLDPGAVEGNFGLRFAARRLNPHSLNEIRSRRIDATSRTQSVQVPIGSDLRNLDVALEGEFVRRLVGEMESSNGVDFPEIGAIVATDSVAFRSGTDLEKVRDTLNFMLREVEESPVREELLFLDSLEPLRSSDPVVEQLEGFLVRSLVDQAEPASIILETPDGSQEVARYILEFSPPDNVSSENAESVEVHRGSTEATMDSMTLPSLKEALKAIGGRFGKNSLKSIKLIALSGDDEPASQLLPLRNWLVFEVGNEESRYILTLGKWFLLNENYTRKLNEDLKKIRDVTEQLSLITWKSDWTEGIYNEEAIKKRTDLALLDKVKIFAEDGDEVESCDLLHEEGFLIHVKRYTKSQTLSHLFSQGFVSAQIIAGDAVYRQRFIEKVANKAPHFKAVAEAAPKTVVYAIGVSGDKVIPADLPTFSKVNLRDFCNRLRGSQVEPTVCRVQIS